MRPIDAEALEQDGWCMSRIVQINEKTMEYQTRKPTDFPIIEPKKGRWIDDCTCSICYWTHEDSNGFALITHYNFCPSCGVDMREGVTE